jgi:hypothetical protein
MDSSLDYLKVLTEWKASRRVVSVAMNSSKQSLNCLGIVVEVTSSGIRVEADGFSIEISLAATRFKWRHDDKDVEPILGICGDRSLFILMPVRERVKDE